MSHPVDPDEWMAHYRQRLADTEARATAARSDLDQVRITERSADGSVQATVDSAGNLVDLIFTEAIRQRDPRGVATDVLRCVSAAQQRIAAEVEQVMQPLIGGSEAMDYVLNRVRSTPAPPAAEPPSGPARRRTPDEDDDDFGGQSYLQRGDS